jgi:hypothetical protein
LFEFHNLSGYFFKTGESLARKVEKRSAYKRCEKFLFEHEAQYKQIRTLPGMQPRRVSFGIILRFAPFSLYKRK